MRKQLRLIFTICFVWKNFLDALVTSSFYSKAATKSIKIEVPQIYLSSQNEDIDEYYSLEDPLDSYDDLLNVNKILSETQYPFVLKESSLNNRNMTGDLQMDSNFKSIRLFKENSSKAKRWEHWDDFMEQEFGDMDAELSEKDGWIKEMREIVEQKRGMAIWSKKTDQEIQNEIKRTAAARSLYIPPAAAKVIYAVFIEKTHTLKELKKEDEVSCLEFRKWVIEQKKKSKKDPLPLARVELSKVCLYYTLMSVLYELILIDFTPVLCISIVVYYFLCIIAFLIEMGDAYPGHLLIYESSEILHPDTQSQ